MIYLEISIVEVHIIATKISYIFFVIKQAIKSKLTFILIPGPKGCKVILEKHHLNDKYLWNMRFLFKRM